MKEKVQSIELDQEQINALLQRASQNKLDETDLDIIKTLVQAIVLLHQAVDDKAASIKRLLRTIFGASSETKKKLFQEEDQQNDDQDDAQDPSQKPPPKKPPKGHGRNGKDDYTGAAKCTYPHESLKPGDICPLCGQGKVYPIKPKSPIRITATPPLTATIHEMESLRCNCCLEVFTADPPEDIGEEKYDEAARSMIAILKYGSGFPFHRLEKLQESLGIPLPAATQWNLVEQDGTQLFPVYDELIRQAAQGDVVHNDDTNMKIQQLIKENKEAGSERKGMFTTGIVSVLQGRHIALFATGRQHAGENLEEILKKRDHNLPPPIHMCDALARNIPKGLQTILANCLTHGRRNFVDILDNFPDECRYVIEQLAIVYKNDDMAKEQGMSAQDRLVWHQQESEPVMRELKAWAWAQLEENKVEPNSGLGKAFAYMQNHWDPLTLFLREPGAPLDNNICERALKKAIQHRKNALFYRTLHGARIGDLFMSFIHTCQLNKVNSFDYLTQLQKNIKEALAAPQKWMPWNYHQNLPNE